jgi:hypothetical protein
MVRFLLIFISLVITGCCYNGLRNKEGYIRVIEKNNYNVDPNTYCYIDTTKIYIETHLEIGGILRDTHNSQYHFIVFYSNGKFGSFIKSKKEINSLFNLSRNDFNPEKARMGFYYFKENKLLMHYYTTNQCEKAKVRCIANFNSDTLSITFLNESIKKNKAYFIKYDVLNEFLDGWKPDW